MSDLRNRAHAKAAGQPEPETAEPAETVNVIEPLPDVEYTAPISDPDKVPVYVAFARAQADVQSIAKSDRRDDAGGRYNFRGVDRVVNAVGPAIRRHGLLVVPVQMYDVEYREAKTSQGKSIQECTLKVKWLVMGPNGDRMPELLESVGQAQDTQDKATSKAVSVAQRVLFLAGMHIPTQDPDVDKGYDRGERPTVNPNQYRDEIVDPRTSLRRLNQIKAELLRHDLGLVVVTNEVGDEEQLGKLLMRFGRERETAAGGEG